MSYKGLEQNHDECLQLCYYLSICILHAMQDFFPVLYPQGYRFLLRPALLAFCEVISEVPGVKPPTAITYKTQNHSKNVFAPLHQSHYKFLTQMWALEKFTTPV